MHYTSYLVAGIAQQLAEIYYIVGAQQLEGYGQVRMVFQYFHSASNTIAFMYTSCLYRHDICSLPINCTTVPNIFSQECFLAKDDAGNEVLLGARYQTLQIDFLFFLNLVLIHIFIPSLIGICVRKSNGQSPQFKWSSITNLVIMIAKTILF